MCIMLELIRVVTYHFKLNLLNKFWTVPQKTMSPTPYPLHCLYYLKMLHVHINYNNNNNNNNNFIRQGEADTTASAHCEYVQKREL